MNIPTNRFDSIKHFEVVQKIGRRTIPIQKEGKKMNTLTNRFDSIKHFEVVQKIERREIPDSMPHMEDDWNLSTEELLARSALRPYITKKLGYAFISYDWVRPFATWIGQRSVLEVLSGKGALSHALKTCHVDVHATDNYSWFEGDDKEEWWTDVENIDALDAIRNYGAEKDILLMSWIPYESDIGYEAIKLYHEVNPNGLVVVIGEGYGGCTADDTFFEHFEKIEDESFDKAVENFQSWFGLHDSPSLGKYRP